MSKYLRLKIQHFADGLGDIQTIETLQARINELEKTLLESAQRNDVEGNKAGNEANPNINTNSNTGDNSEGESGENINSSGNDQLALDEFNTKVDSVVSEMEGMRTVFNQMNEFLIRFEEINTNQQTETSSDEDDYRAFIGG